MNHPSPLSVLVVDDSEKDLLITARLLEAAGFTPPFATVEDSVRAKELLEEKGDLFNLAFFDLRMPVIDGLQLLAWARARPELAHLKIVIITADDDPVHIAQARELGADGWFSKFPSAPKLAAILQDVAPGVLSGHRR